MLFRCLRIGSLASLMGQSLLVGVPGEGVFGLLKLEKRWFPHLYIYTMKQFLERKFRGDTSNAFSPIPYLVGGIG